MTLTAAFKRPFKYQVAAFRLRLGQLAPTAVWTDIWQEQHDRAFMVAGAMKADLLADLAAAVEKAIAKGTSLEEFRGDFRRIVEERGWHGWTGEGTKKGEAWRTRVIYRTNMATSYAAGRWAQIVDQGAKFVVYRHGNSLEPRVHHLAWDGLILPIDHPFWATHAPPNGWGCSCYVNGAFTIREAQRLGGKPGKELPPGWEALDPRTAAPKGIDKGWAYAPGASVADAVAVLADKVPVLPAELGAQLWAMAPEVALAARTRQFADFVDTALSSQVQQRHMVVGALAPAWVSAARRAGVTIASSEIAITDRAIAHMFRGTSYVTIPGTRQTGARPKVDPLGLDWFKDLPRHLKSPTAVVLDTSADPADFMLIYRMSDSNAWLVIKLNAELHKRPGQVNLVTSGRQVDDRAIQSLIGRGVVLLAGEI